MTQLLILIAVIFLIYAIRKISQNSQKKLDYRHKSQIHMVKCASCGLNLPDSEAIKKDNDWYCSKEQKN
tara:strand:+ start:1230 stop:1436 length:207 start_codon:yes stop_codon:yes gene_type:complete